MKLRIKETPNTPYHPLRMVSHSIKFDENKMIACSDILKNNLTERVEDFKPNEKGGIIILSEEVNAIDVSSNKLINWIKQKVNTINNKINRNKKIDTIAKKYNLVGWTIGRYLDGRYTAKNGKCFGEKSLSVEIIGITTNTLISIAEELCKAFNQEAVLVKSYSDNRVMYISLDE